MGHTKYSNLKDLIAEFELIRSLPGIKEKSPGIFYYKSLPFLHFHDKDGSRWADIRDGDGWKKVVVPFEAKPKDKAALLKMAKQLHTRISK